MTLNNRGGSWGVWSGTAGRDLCCRGAHFTDFGQSGLVEFSFRVTKAALKWKRGRRVAR